jgi:hypothetical protein
MEYSCAVGRVDVQANEDANWAAAGGPNHSLGWPMFLLEDLNLGWQSVFDMFFIAEKISKRESEEVRQNA